MGTWGLGILQDDLAADAYGDFMERFNAGAEPDALHKVLIASYEESRRRPEFWLGLARAQWECGALAPSVLRQAKRATSKAALAIWAEADRSKRKRLVEAFLARISTPNPKPKRRVKPRSWKAVFEPGACLVVETYRGGYGKAIVLDVVSHGNDVFHLIGGLKGMHAKVPPLRAYEKREWLRLTHHASNGALHLSWCPASAYKRDAAELAIVQVGITRIRADDPRSKPFAVGIGHSGWGWIENQIWKQAEWDKGKR